MCPVGTVTYLSGRSGQIQSRLVCTTASISRPRLIADLPRYSIIAELRRQLWPGAHIQHLRSCLRMPHGQPSRIPSLDGLRAVSIALVVLGHLTGTRNFPSIPLIGSYANFGVRVFFVISGYLIT